MDMYIVHVHTCLCIYLCMHVLLITINAFRIIRAVARSHPLSSTPSFLLPLKAQPGRSTDWFNQQKWGDKPNFSKIGYYWFRNWCEVPPFVVRLLSVQKINIWRVRKIAALFPNQPCVSGMLWVCPGLVHFNGGLWGSASMVIWSASHDGTVLAMMGTPLSIATSLGVQPLFVFKGPYVRGKTP